MLFLLSGGALLTGAVDCGFGGRDWCGITFGFFDGIDGYAGEVEPFEAVWVVALDDG